MRACAFVVLAATFAAACGGDDRRANICGDGIVGSSEECDDGNQISGDGCEMDCRFSCVASDATRNCAPADACAGQGVCSEAHTCMAGTPLLDGMPCGTSKFCVSDVCTLSICGDGVRQFGEDCDDSNTANLDGCDSACKFEQVARVTSLQQQFATDTFCTKNALGAAIATVAQPIIQATWDQPIADGSMSLVFKFLGFIDPSGATSKFKLGFVDALPIRFGQSPDDPTVFSDNYSGLSDLDWWYYLRDPASVGTTGMPLSQLDGEATNGHVTAGPGTIDNLRLLFALQPTNVKLLNVHIDTTFDTKQSRPTEASTATPPGHLPGEHLAPDFSTFESSGLATGSNLGGMCSDVSSKSLADTVMPGLLTLCADPADPTGATPEFFVGDGVHPDNHLLDAFIVGCKFFSFDENNNPAFVPTILPAQPDGSVDGATYVFAADPATHQVTSCTKNGQPGDLNGCYANAIYSSYFKLAADRVILRADKPPILP